MKKSLTEQERERLDRRVAEAEQRTGAQIVLAVVEQSDVYAEIPWKAFALAAGAGSIAAVLFDMLCGTWASPAAALLAVAAALVPGAVAAVMCVFVPGFSRVFLDQVRAEVETRQYAESLFLSRELFATRGRNGILLLASLFERRVVVLPDTGLSRRLRPAAVQEIIDATTTAFADGTVAFALEAGITELERLLAAAAPAVSGGDELPNTIVEEGRS